MQCDKTWSYTSGACMAPDDVRNPAGVPTTWQKASTLSQFPRRDNVQKRIPKSQAREEPIALR